MTEYTYDYFILIIILLVYLIVQEICCVFDYHEEVDEISNVKIFEKYPIHFFVYVVDIHNMSYAFAFSF